MPDQDGGLVEGANLHFVVVDDLGQAETFELIGVLAELCDVALLARPLGCRHIEALGAEVLGEVRQLPDESQAP